MLVSVASPSISGHTHSKTTVTYGGAVLTFPFAKRLECAELAPAFGTAAFNDSSNELEAHQTLRVTALPLFPYISAFRAAHTKERVVAAVHCPGVGRGHDISPSPPTEPVATAASSGILAFLAPYLRYPARYAGTGTTGRTARSQPRCSQSNRQGILHRRQAFPLQLAPRDHGRHQSLARLMVSRERVPRRRERSSPGQSHAGPRGGDHRPWCRIHAGPCGAGG